MIEVMYGIKSFQKKFAPKTVCCNPARVVISPLPLLVIALLDSIKVPMHGTGIPLHM